MYKTVSKCDYYDMLAQLIVIASGSNMSLKLYVSRGNDYLKAPALLTNSGSSPFFMKSKFSSPILRLYGYPSIIYCFNLRKATTAETTMWTKYVPLNIWCLVGLFILTNGFINTPVMSRKNVCVCILYTITMFLNSCFKSLGIILRQSWGHKWKLLGIFELLFSILISIYENSITVSVVVPLVPKPFSTTIDLYNDNFTFVVRQLGFKSINDWLSGKYNMANNSRVLGIHGFWVLSTWLEKYFLTQTNEVKYAIVGCLSKNFHFQAVTYLKEKNDTCYHMYPTEEVFDPIAIYFTFPSASGSSLQKGTMLLQAYGFVNAFDNSKNFRDSLVAIGYARGLGTKHGLKGTTFKDIYSNRLNESIITLGNIKSVCLAGLIIILSASVCFFAEVCSKTHFLQCFNNRKRNRVVVY